MVTFDTNYKILNESLKVVMRELTEHQFVLLFLNIFKNSTFSHRKEIIFTNSKICDSRKFCSYRNNLQNINVKFPLNTLTVVTGVSGSGKTTLVKQILYPALKRQLGQSYPIAPGMHDELTGSLKRITQIEMVNQNPIGKSSRSNPVTYVKAYDTIRNLMAAQQLSRIRGYQAKHFSFNVDAGR